MSADGKFNYYAILEVDQHAPQHEVTTAFERAKKTYSGDNPAIYTIFSQDEAREYLKIIEEAYSVLGNKTLRSMYDKKLFGKSSVEDLSYASLLKASQANMPQTKKVEKIVPVVDEAMEKEIREKTDWSGPDLKKVREYRGLSIERLSQITKINSYYIRAIEDMNAKGLPAYVFVRGYVLQIVRELGLDQKNVTDSFIKNYKTIMKPE
ncbi:MAG: helix-turn-helix domain-containing protein [Bdellovibrionota bacterium]